MNQETALIIGELSITTEQIRLAQYVFFALIGLVVIMASWRWLRVPVRRRQMAGLARRLNFDFLGRLTFSNAQPLYTYPANEAHHGVLLSDHDAMDPPHKLHIDEIARGSVLNDPRFFNAFNTSQVRNYCCGRYRGCAVEVFDWQQSRRRNDRSARGPRSTVVILHLGEADLPWFIAVPSFGASRRKIANSIQPAAYPAFNTAYQLQAPDGHPNSENRILSLLSRRALELLVDSSTVRVRAAGPHLLFSHGNVLLTAGKIDDLLDFGLKFCHRIDLA
jgi:hypothetical protein